MHNHFDQLLTSPPGGIFIQPNNRGHGHNPDFPVRQTPHLNHTYLIINTLNPMHVDHSYGRTSTFRAVDETTRCESHVDVSSCRLITLTPTDRPTDRPTDSDRPTMTHLTKQPFLTLLSPSDTATISSRFPYDFPTISLRRRKLQKSFKCLTKSCLEKLPQKIASKVASKVASKIASKKFASCSL